MSEDVLLTLRLGQRAVESYVWSTATCSSARQPRPRRRRPKPATPAPDQNPPPGSKAGRRFTVFVASSPQPTLRLTAPDAPRSPGTMSRRVPQAGARATRFWTIVDAPWMAPGIPARDRYCQVCSALCRCDLGTWRLGLSCTAGALSEPSSSHAVRRRVAQICPFGGWRPDSQGRTSRA